MKVKSDSQQDKLFLFVGLGNPGVQYENTRHNLGFLVIQAFAQLYGWSLKKDLRFNGLVYKGLLEQKVVHLLQPLTYMNLSGVSLKRYIDYFKIPTDRIVVVVDDTGLSFGDLLIKPSGSAAGHNGLRSIEEQIGSHYMRLRMGIGHPRQLSKDSPEDNGYVKKLADYVLEPFNQKEQQQLPDFVNQGVMVLRSLLQETASFVMNQVNTHSRLKRLDPEHKGLMNQSFDERGLDVTKPPKLGEEKI